MGIKKDVKVYVTIKDSMATVKSVPEGVLVIVHDYDCTCIAAEHYHIRKIKGRYVYHD